MTFSIITVTYNAAQWLERTIQSVIFQTYPQIEYIIVDGGSTDGTLDIITDYKSRITLNSQLSTFNFQFISEPDRGLYDAMNKGLKLATGDYVWFINAGDRLYSEHIAQEIIDRIDKNRLPDIIYGETEIIDSQGNTLGMRRLKAPETLTWKSFRMGMLVCHQSFIVKKKIAPAYELNYRFASDIDWCIRCMKKAGSILNTHLVLSCFLEAGTSAANRKASLKERYRIMCEYYGKIPTQIRHLWFAFRFFVAKWTKKTVS